MVAGVAVVACQPGVVAGDLAPRATQAGEIASSTAPTVNSTQGPPETSAPSAPSGGADRADRPALSETAVASGADAPIAITAIHACRVPGQSQTVTVRATPGYQVTVNPRYADGQMGNIHGGLAFAQTVGDDGTFTHTWTISAQAPVGPVEVLAGAQPIDQAADPDTTSVFFDLSDTCA